MSILSEYIQFLSSPKREIFVEMSFINRLKDIIPLFFMVFLFVVLVIGPLVTLVGLEGAYNKIEDLSDLGFENGWANRLAFLGLAVLIAPIIEEIVFRFPLKYKLGSILLAACAIGIFSFGLLSMIGMENTQSSAIGATMAFAFFSLIVLTNRAPTELFNEVKKWFPFFFYAAAFLFAIVHLANYDLPSTKWLVAPVLVLPQLLLGFMLGYVRLKHGIIAAMLVHAMNNLIPSLLMLFIPN